MEPDWIKSTLKDKGYTQADLAEWIGVDTSAANRICKGTRQLKAREAEIIASYLGAAPITLLEHEDDDMVSVRIQNGDVVSYTPFETWFSEGKLLSDGMRVVVEFEDASTLLCLLGSVGTQELFYPIELGKVDDPIPFQFEGPFDTGTAEINGKTYRYRILGIFRRLVTTDNS